MTVKFVVSNFPDGRDSKKQVPWVKLEEGLKVRGLGKGISPEVVLAILDSDQAAVRKVCNAAVAQAASVNQPAQKATSAPPPPPVAVEQFACFDGQNVGPYVNREGAMQFAMANSTNDSAQIFVVSTNSWTTKDKWAGLGLVPPPVPAPPAVPTAPTVAPAAPAVEQSAPAVNGHSNGNGRGALADLIASRK